MTLGSGIFNSKRPNAPHLNTGEVADLRADIKAEFSSLAAIVVEEFTDPPAAGAALISVAALTQVAAGRSATLLPLAANISPPRNITVTNTGTGTPADVPASATVTGKDINGVTMTEVLTIPQTATITPGAKAFASVSSIVEGVGEGATGTLSYGIGTLIGLGKKAAVRGGLVAVVKEIAAGSLAPTPGAFVVPATGAPNGTYAPSSAADGTRDYCLYYELDTSTNKDA